VLQDRPQHFSVKSLHIISRLPKLSKKKGHCGFNVKCICG